MKLQVLIVLIGMHVLLLLSDTTGALNTIRGRFEIWLLPLQQVSRDSMQSLQRSISFLGTFGEVYEQNNRLQQEIRELREQVGQTTALQKEVESLKKQLGSPITQTSDSIAVRVIGFSRKDDNIYLVLNSGAEQGIVVGDAVILGQSLIGKVIATSPHRATVLPIIATQSIVPAYVQDGEGTRVNGVVHGEFNSGLVLSQFVREKTLERQEFVFSSGLDGNYPAGLLIGQVSQVTSAKANVFQEALLVPMWDMATLDTVFVVSTRADT